MNSSLSSGCKTNLSSSTRQVAHECFYFTSHSIDYCCFLANLTTHSFAYFTSIWWLLLISCPGISSNTEKCLSRFNIRISFCLHLDFASDTNFSLATSSAVEKLFLPAWTKYIYTFSPLLSVCSQPLLLLCVSHNAPCCLLFYSREHHNGCPLHYMWPAYSSGAAVEFEYFPHNFLLFWVVTVVTVQA